MKITPDGISDHPNFKIFLGGMPPDPPRMSCYAAELPSATVVFTSLVLSYRSCPPLSTSFLRPCLLILVYLLVNSPTYVEHLTLFLTTSFHHDWPWVKINFGYIQLDYGIHIVYRGLKSSDITITELWLFISGLTSSSSMLVSDTCY